MKKVIWGIIGILVLGLVGYEVYKYEKSSHAIVQKEHNALSVDVIEAHPTTKTIQKTYVGYVKPINEVAVLSYIPGFIEQVNVSGGQEVKEGDLLFVIKQDQYKAQLDLAQAKVQQATAANDNAKLYYERMQNAGARAISKTDLDNAKTQFLSATAALAEANANLELAKVNYNYTTITSTLPGLVGDVQITKGDYVSPEGSPLVTIIQYNPMRVLFSISTKEYLTEVISGQDTLLTDWQLKLRLADGSIFKQPGTIKYLNNEVTPQTGSIAVYADFNNPDKNLIANAYVDVLLEKEVKNGFFLPQNVVNLDADGAYIYIVRNNLIQRQPVVVGPSIGNEYWIKSGISDSMQVITDKISVYEVGKPVTIKGSVQ